MLLIRPQSAGTRPDAGLSVLEVMLALAMIMIGLTAMTTTTLATHKLRRSDSDRQLAVAALESLLEEVQVVAESTPKDGTDWASQVLATFAAPADRFPVLGLDPWDGEPSVLSVEILSNETLSDDTLGFNLGMPRDLDNDGASDNPDVTDTARMLPVIVRARWQSSAGDRELVQGAYLLGY